MKLRSLALNQFKKFSTPKRLDAIEDGLNIIAGPNEMGKSTLLDALRAVLFEKYNSRAKPIVTLQNDRNQAGPVVELTFDLDDAPYRIIKRFIKKPYAHLFCPDGRKLEGDAAEEGLRNLLGFGESGKMGAKPETLGMWNVLWVRQGESFNRFDLPESARSNLHNALESEVGAVLGGYRGRALPQAVEKRRGELVTVGGRPRNSYKRFIERDKELRNEVENLQVRRQDLFQTLERLDDAQKTLARLVSSNRDREDRSKRDEMRQRYNQRFELEVRIKAALADLRSKKHASEQAERVAVDRQRLVEEIKMAEDTLNEAERRLAEAQRQEGIVQFRLDELRASLNKAEAASDDADRVLSHAQRVRDTTERQARIHELEKAVDAEKRGNEAFLEAETIRATDQTIKAVRYAKTRLEAADRNLRIAATLISFDMTDENMSGVEIDGQPLTADRRSVRVIETTAITIPERGRITVEPAIEDRNSLLHLQREAKTALVKALEEAGATTVEGAENQYVKRQDLLRDAKFARQEAELYATASGNHKEGAQVLAVHLGGQRRFLDREMKQLDLQHLPARSEAEKALRNTEEQAAEARNACKTMRAEMTAPEEELVRSRTESGTAEALREDAGTRLENLRCQLQAAERERSREELQAAIEAARTAQVKQEDEVAGLEAEAQRAGETLEQLQARIDRLEQAIKTRSDKRATLREEVAGLKGRVEILNGAGLDEVIAEKKREMELCAEELERRSREVQVLDLLLSTLRSAEREAKERYLLPVLKRVRPYLQILFPDADIRVDENFRIEGVVREAGHKEPFQQLSMGTREQIAVLIRLAFAEMLVEGGHPASVVLDDALAFSDDQRMGRIFYILNKASRSIQIVIFTCREQLFEGLGGKRLTLQAADVEELSSA